MRLILKIITTITFSFLFILNAFAISAPTELKLDSSDSNSVNLSWNTVDGAYMYYIQYSKGEVTDGVYDNITEYVDINSTIISNLEEGNTYYFSVVALDENGDESNSSSELIVNIIKTIDFALTGAEAISTNEIELSFSLPLNDSSEAIREFKVVNKNDSLDSFEVIGTKLNNIDSSKLIITLDRETVNENEYEVTVIAINSLEGKNIESGIDSIASFISNNIVAVIEPEIIEETPELNSASTNTTNGEIIETENMDKTIITTASTNSTLPKTGPEYVIMIILSIILGAIFFMFKHKRAN